MGCGDYYAISDFIKQFCADTDSPSKFIVFVGELGAADGTKGMYRYMMDHPNLILVASLMLSEEHETDMFGHRLEKKVYVFQLKHNKS